MHCILLYIHLARSVKSRATPNIVKDYLEELDCTLGFGLHGPHGCPKELGLLDCLLQTLTKDEPISLATILNEFGRDKVLTTTLSPNGLFSIRDMEDVVNIVPLGKYTCIIQLQTSIHPRLEFFCSSNCGGASLQGLPCMGIVVTTKNKISASINLTKVKLAFVGHCLGKANRMNEIVMKSSLIIILSFNNFKKND